MRTAQPTMVAIAALVSRRNGLKTGYENPEWAGTPPRYRSFSDAAITAYFRGVGGGFLISPYQSPMTDEQTFKVISIEAGDVVEWRSAGSFPTLDAAIAYAVLTL